MGILSKASAKLSAMRKARHSRQVENLLKDTAEAVSRFKSEAKRLGIDLGNVTQKNYYDILGIKYTNDHKAIRRAYIEMVKRYHPDVSTEKDATKKSTEVNEAYAVLKDQKSKEEYDTLFSKGKNSMGPEVTKGILDILIKNYSEARNRDFKEFNERVATPQSRDAVNAAINEALDWGHAFNEAKKKTFGRLIDAGRSIRKLASANRGMAKQAVKEDADSLPRNLEELESMEKAFGEIEKGLDSIISGATGRIREDESKIEAKLRR